MKVVVLLYCPYFSVESFLKYGHTGHMGISQIKVTYSLDMETCRKVETLARLWVKSKSEVIRAVVALVNPDAIGKTDKINALDHLQKKKPKQRELVQWAKTSRNAWR